MRISILAILIAAFIQTSFLQVNLCLVLIICRSLIVERDSDYPIAFFSGLLLGILSSQNLGFWPVVFLILVKLIKLFKKLPFSSNYLTILPISLVLILSTAFLEKLIFNQSLNYLKIVFEFILILPTYVAMLFWEDRFVIEKDIKLKIRE
ncbi:hypothetical protein HYS97_01970 [Candidatus Daviesbacteria bacterium]|nr:hypothetical protein [Candidatus Daviesbacteria bacterium]